MVAEGQHVVARACIGSWERSRPRTNRALLQSIRGQDRSHAYLCRCLTVASGLKSSSHKGGLQSTVWRGRGSTSLPVRESARGSGLDREQTGLWCNPIRGQDRSHAHLCRCLTGCLWPEVSSHKGELQSNVMTWQKGSTSLPVRVSACGSGLDREQTGLWRNPFAVKTAPTRTSAVV